MTISQFLLNFLQKYFVYALHDDQSFSPVLPDNRPIPFRLPRQERQQGNKTDSRLSHIMSCARWTWRGWQVCATKKNSQPSELKFPRNIYIRVWSIARLISLHVFRNIDLLRSSHTNTIEHGLAYDLSINGNTYGNDNMKYSIGGFIIVQISGARTERLTYLFPTVPERSPFCPLVRRMHLGY